MSYSALGSTPSSHVASDLKKKKKTSQDGEVQNAEL